MDFANFTPNTKHLSVSFYFKDGRSITYALVRLFRRLIVIRDGPWKEKKYCDSCDIGFEITMWWWQLFDSNCGDIDLDVIAVVIVM